MSVTLLSID